MALVSAASGSHEGLSVGRTAIEQLLYLMDEAFDSPGAHSLLANLRSLRDEDWVWVPPGGSRRIFDVVRHVGECKYVYDNHAFGDATMRWGQPGTLPTVEHQTPSADVIDWLREGQRRLKASVASLKDDGELLQLRRANWGRSYETRWLVKVMIEHDLYHGGEINHIRALHHGNDRWAYDRA